MSRSLRLLRDRGYVCDVTERKIPKTFISKDLFGFVDILALKGGETLAVQTTSAANLAARIKKIRESENLPAVLGAGWSVVVHGWRKSGRRWVCREEYVRGSDPMRLTKHQAIV